MEKSTIIIGHKNPDTDSICSALGYEALKKALGEENVIAARAGNINPQAEFVLRHFGKEQPVYLSDVYPKIRDVMTTDFASVPQKASLCSVINAMGNKNVRFMPVTENGRPVGLLSMSTLAEQLIVGNPAAARKVCTSISNVIEALQASPAHVISAEKEFTASVFVGAMAEETFKDVIQKGTSKDCIVIVGDREDIQHAAIEREVRLLIITGGLGIMPKIERAAKDKGVSVIISPFDSATTAWLTLLPIRFINEPVGSTSTLIAERFLRKG